MTSIPWGTIALVGIGTIAVLAIARELSDERESRTSVFETTSASRKTAARENRTENRRELKEQRLDALAEAALAKARTKMARENIRADRLLDRASKSATRSAARNLESKALTATRSIGRLDDIATRIENGQYTAGELKELMKSGTLRLSG